jgi:flagellar biosynthesis protein
MIYKHFQSPSRKKKEELKRAAVIRYDKEKDNAPVIIAQGRGELAEKIIAQAKQHEIPLQEDALLLENLLELDLGANVPPQLYQVVAEVLLLVRRANIEDPIHSVRPFSVKNTPYWIEDDDEENEVDEDITIEDLLESIRNL